MSLTPNLTQLDEHDLRQLRKRGVGNRRELVHDLSQLLIIARTIIADGNDATRIEAVLRLAVDRLGVGTAYARTAECLFGLTDDTRSLEYKERWKLALKHHGGAKTTFSSRGCNEVCTALARKLLDLYKEHTDSLLFVRQDHMSESFPLTVPQRMSAIFSTDCFDTCVEGENHCQRELTSATGDRPRTWWHTGSSGWLGSFFVFWHKNLTTSCGDIHYTYDQGAYDSARFAAVAPDGDNPKAVVVSADPFQTDRLQKTLHCGITNWDFCHNWAEINSQELLASSVQPSVFGLVGRLAYPGLTAVHTLLITSDGYILFALRSGPDHIALLPDTWSVSFEEQVSLTQREHTSHLPRDETVLDTIEAGMHEEWGLPPAAIETSSCLALGREYIEIPGSPPRLILNFAIITAVRLSVDLAGVWSYLDDASKIRDRDEHQAWVGCRFTNEVDIKSFLQTIRPSVAGDAENIWAHTRSTLDLDLVAYSGGHPLDGLKDFGVTPTSAVRLLMGAAWLASLRVI